MATAAALSMGVTACSFDDPNPLASGRDDRDRPFLGLRGAAPTQLQEGRSCDAVLEDFQRFAPTVFRDAFGIGLSDVAELDVAAGAGAAAEDSAPAAGAPTADETVARTGGVGGDGSTSDTNTQEQGIDEPDVVETDGEFVYLVDQDQLVILDGATAAVVSRTPLAGYGAQLLLSGDRLLAVTSGGYAYAPGGPLVAVDAVAAEAAPQPEPAPGSDPGPLPVDPPSFPAGTVLQLVDVSDRSAPRTVQTTELEGQHVSTRVVDGVARVVITSYPQPPVLFEGDAFDEAVSGGGAGFDPDRVEAVMADRVAETTIDDWLPAFRTTTAATTVEPVEGPIVACEDVLVPEVNAGVAETSVLKVDFTDGFDPADTTTVVAEAGTVYASATTLYIAATRHVSGPARAEIAPDDWSTALHAFDLRGDGAVAHVGAGEVPGSTLNQYSLSEFDGYLRIATTEGTPWGGGPESESAVRVLRLDGDELVEVGIVSGLGRTETIQSVRFMGPVGYVVTFRQTDPLYVIDLSDPAAPRAVGELKIPGFSSYLHPTGEGRLVGIGRDADLEGRDQGLLVSLFDVSDPTAPAQLQTYTERDAWSAAGNDPKAFLWWAPETAVVIPVERFAASTPARPEGLDVGMTVLDVADDGITPRATVTADGRYPSRALVVQGRLWSLFDGAVVTSDFADPANGTFHPLR